MSSHTHTNLNVRNNTQNTSLNYAHKQMYTYSLLSGMVSSAATALREDLNLQLLLLLVFLLDSVGLHLGLCTEAQSGGQCLHTWRGEGETGQDLDAGLAHLHLRVH